MSIVAVIPAAPPPEPQELRENALALARLMARLRTLASEDGCDRTAVTRRMAEVEQALEWTGTTYFEAHCHPHLPRLVETERRASPTSGTTSG